MRRFFASSGSCAVTLSLVLAACGGSSGSGPSDGGGGQATHPDASCAVTLDSPPDEGATHVPVGTPVQYGSNPPSSGSHYPIWAAYQEYSSPVPRSYYVHDLEHGAIVFLYNCPGGAGGCPDVVAGLRALAASIPDDPLCIAAAEGVRARIVITPDPLIPTPVAAAAWDWTYVADCFDAPTLEQFAHDHYGHGREDLCNNGVTAF